MNSPRPGVRVRLARSWREVRWFLRCIRKGYPPEVYRTISPHPPPPAVVERLRQRILTGNWSDPLPKIVAPVLPSSSVQKVPARPEASDEDNESGAGAA